MVKAIDAAEVVSLKRGLDVLRAFRASDAPLGNKEIASLAGLAPYTRGQSVACERIGLG